MSILKSETMVVAHLVLNLHIRTNLYHTEPHSCGIKSFWISHLFYTELCYYPRELLNPYKKTSSSILIDALPQVLWTLLLFLLKYRVASFVLPAPDNTYCSVCPWQYILPLLSKYSLGISHSSCLLLLICLHGLLFLHYLLIVCIFHYSFCSVPFCVLYTSHGWFNPYFWLQLSSISETKELFLHFL